MEVKSLGPVISGTGFNSRSLLGMLLRWWTFIVSALLLIKVPKSKFFEEKPKGDTGFMLSGSKWRGRFVRFHKTKLHRFYRFMDLVPYLLFVIQIIDTQLMILLRDWKCEPCSLSGIAIANGIGMLVFSIFLTRLKIRTILPYLGTVAPILGICICNNVDSSTQLHDDTWFQSDFFLELELQQVCFHFPLQLSVQKLSR